MYNYSCNDTTSTLGINSSWHGLCKSASSLCCAHHIDTQSCASGRSAAKQLNCIEAKFENVTSTFKDCCKSCEIGIAVAAENGSCSDNQIIASMGQHAAEAFSICCKGIEEEDEEIVINDGGCSLLIYERV